jgi:hypothetical protein
MPSPIADGSVVAGPLISLPHRVTTVIFLFPHRDTLNGKPQLEGYRPAKNVSFITISAVKTNRKIGEQYIENHHRALDAELFSGVLRAIIVVLRAS